MNGGELFTHLNQHEQFTEDQVRVYIGEIVLALENLHKVRWVFFLSQNDKIYLQVIIQKCFEILTCVKPFYELLYKDITSCLFFLVGHYLQRYQTGEYIVGL